MAHVPGTWRKISKDQRWSTISYKCNVIIYTVSSFVVCKTTGFQVNLEECNSKPSFGSF